MMKTLPLSKSEVEKLTERLKKSVTLKLSPKDRRAQRISWVMSIADDPSDPEERRRVEELVDEMY